MRKKYYFFLSTVITILFSSFAFCQSTIFEDNFDSYTAGQHLACQNPVNWTTWTLNPCSSVEDAFVSNVNAYSGANSVVIVPSNDLVHRLGDVTTGKYKISFLVYIPTGKTGYFNTMSSFTNSVYKWAVSVHFNPGGSGQVFPFGNFSFTYDSWQNVELKVDLDNDMAEFYFEYALVGTPFPWTLMGDILKLAAVDFWGPAESEMYVDDFKFELLSPTEVLQEASQLPENFTLLQNYPNPFNPLTTIEFTTPKSGFITLKVYDNLGKEISVLVNEEKPAGTYSVIFDGSNISSGVYFYKIQIGAFTDIKKLVLLK
ncbi:MAG: T9SS type A sorting domain-containing protein [Ignavibacteria bacterium]|nr:T9SS type A sorting domain-containing protein [Ignavibacteria bacterium]